MKRYSKEGNATPFAPFLLPPEEDEEEDEDHIQMELQSDCYKNSDHDMDINMNVEMAPAGEQDAPRGLQQQGNDKDDVITKDQENNGDELLAEAVQTTTTASLFSTESTTSNKADEGAPSSASSEMSENIKPAAAKNILSNAVLPPAPPRLKSSGRGRMLPPSCNINKATITKMNKEKVTVAPPAASQNKKQPIFASTEATAAEDHNPPAEQTKSTIKTTETDQKVKMVREQGYRNAKGSTEILDENILPEQPSTSSIEPDDALAVVPAPAQSTSSRSSSSSSSCAKHPSSSTSSRSSSCAIIKEVNKTSSTKNNNTELPSTTTRPTEEILESDDGEELVLKTRPGVVAADAGQQRPQVGNLLSAELTMQPTSDAHEEDDGEELVLMKCKYTWMMSGNL